MWSRDEFRLSLSEYNPLNGPGPLGLRLTKSASLLELIQTTLSQNNKPSPNEIHQVGNKKHVKGPIPASGPSDKLKASNFPALLLKIGKWEYVSQHEGDLVAKCYFAKHKLVWEVLDGGLKNKIEIQWSDIVDLKANCPDNGPGSLTILLGKQPLFFRETDPQPRKHTLWQGISDFTNGEASTYRQHYLQCAQGVLDKHYEKLIQCDTRLNFLSQQPSTILDLPLAAKDPNVSCNTNNNGCNQLEISNGLSASGINNTGTLVSVNQDFIKEYGHGEILDVKIVSMAGVDQNDYPNPDCNPIPEKGEDFGMSRKDSFSDFLHKLPRITSLPSFMFDLSDDYGILNRRCKYEHVHKD